MEWPEEYLETEENEDILESQAFYEIMQVYRWSNVQTPIDFEEVKLFIRKYYNHNGR